MIFIVDDGTLDTVLRCSLCGRESRFNYDGDRSYTAFRKWARSDMSADHADCADRARRAKRGPQFRDQSKG